MSSMASCGWESTALTEAKHAVRLVTFRQGNTLRRYITNVREPDTFPIASMAEVYARRWDIEMALKLVKQHLKLRLLWSAKRVVILQQIWATLIISQVLQSLRLEIAQKAGVDPFEVSIGLLVEYAPQYAYEGRDPVKVFVERGRELGFIRPSRRTRIHAPSIPGEAILPAPPALALTRTPRYANRKCHRPIQEVGELKKNTDSEEQVEDESRPGLLDRVGAVASTAKRHVSRSAEVMSGADIRPVRGLHGGSNHSRRPVYIETKPRLLLREQISPDQAVIGAVGLLTVMSLLRPSKTCEERAHVDSRCPSLRFISSFNCSDTLPRRNDSPEAYYRRLAS